MAKKPSVAELLSGGAWLPAPVTVQAFVHRETKKAVAIVRSGDTERVVDKFARIPLPDDGSPLVARLSKARGPGEILRRAASAVLKFGPALGPLLGIPIPPKVLAVLETVKKAESTEERFAGVIQAAGPSWLKDAWSRFEKAMEDGKVEVLEGIEIVGAAMGVDQ